MEIVEKYFSGLLPFQREQFEMMEGIYKEWNAKINVISRRDMDNFVIHHLLYSLAIGKIINFSAGTKIIDVGTGGGFPGIPLAILFPEAEFFLVDSIGKKIRVVDEVIKELGLKNVKAEQARVEELKEKFDYVVSRAVTAFPAFVKLTNKLIRKKQNIASDTPNGIFYLKGGDFEEEIKFFKERIRVYNVSDFFKESFFETKKIVYMESL